MHITHDESVKLSPRPPQSFMERHRKKLEIIGAFDSIKQAHRFDGMPDDDALAQCEALLQQLAELKRIEDAVVPPMSASEIAWSVWSKTDGACTYCKVTLNPFSRTASNGFQTEHVNPRAQGGTDDLTNLVPSCRDCNFSKGGRTPEEWMAARD